MCSTAFEVTTYGAIEMHIIIIIIITAYLSSVSGSSSLIAMIYAVMHDNICSSLKCRQW